MIAILLLALCLHLAVHSCVPSAQLVNPPAGIDAAKPVDEQFTYGFSCTY